MLFMARSMARVGRCCQLDCPRADGLFTPDCGQRTTDRYCMLFAHPSPVEQIAQWHTQTKQFGGLGYKQPLGQRKATAANGDNKVNGIFSSGCGGETETETVGGNRVWPWLTGCGCGCCRCVIQQNNQQRARVFKPSQIYFLMLFFCNFPHFTLVFHASSALWSSSQWQYLTMLLSLLLLSPRPENGRLN